MAKIEFLVMDVDGTLTDGKIYMGEAGELCKAFSIKDGYGIKEILPQYGIIPIIITARNSRILSNRCEELDITEIHQGVRKKAEKLDEIINAYKLVKKTDFSYGNIAYIGDDVLDLQCMTPIKKMGGLIGCPADACAEVVAIADFISTKKGGDGVVRDFIEWLIHTSHHATKIAE